MGIRDLGAASRNDGGSARSEKPEQMPPNTRWHAELLQLWKKLLKTESISIDDDFFRLGGDSYLALDLHFEVERLSGQKLPEMTVIQAPTIRSLAERLSRQS
jgi:oxalate---CoA ligase